MRNGLAAATPGATLEFLNRERGRRFDPELVDIFMANLPEILEVKQRWSEAVPAESALP